MIYKIDHMANLDHDKQCLIVETTKSKEEMLLILVGMQFRYEELVDESGCLMEKHILDMLKRFYGVKDVKNQYEKYLPQMRLPHEEWRIFNQIKINEDFVITQIDLHDGRESMCIKGGAEKAKKALPEGKEYLEFVRMLLKAPEYEKEQESFPKPIESGSVIVKNQGDGNFKIFGADEKTVVIKGFEIGVEYEEMNSIELIKDTEDEFEILRKIRGTEQGARIFLVERFEGGKRKASWDMTQQLLLMGNIECQNPQEFEECRQHKEDFENIEDQLKIIEFCTKADGAGLAIMVNLGEEEQFLGQDGALICGVPDGTGEYDFLNSLKFFENDGDEILTKINELRNQGIDARLVDMSRICGSTIIESDLTEKYIKLKFIVGRVG